MKKCLIISLFLVSIIATPEAYPQSGDIAFWLQEPGLASTSNPQVKRNGEYFSLKLHSVFAFYKSGFFENIKKLLVVTETSVSEENRSTIQSTMVNKVWQQLDQNGDFIGVNDHLVVLSPATTSNLKIKVAFRGIGEDRFKFLFEALADPKFKAALSLSPATSSTIAAIAPTVQKLVASPYTADDPRQILDISQSYIVYADTNQLKIDSLREGYLVIVSSREKKSADLEKVLSLGSKAMRLSSSGNGLEYFEDNEWKQFKNNSYVVLSVTKTPIRGENEYSNWFSKYIEAERTAEEKLLMGDSIDNVKSEAIGLWREGNALLFADANYIHSERVAIKGKHLRDIQTLLAAKGGVEKAKLDTKALGVPQNFRELAVNYEAAVAKQSAQITVTAEGEGGVPLPNRKFRLTGLNASGGEAVVKSTDQKGELVLKGLSAGMYKIESAERAEGRAEVIIVDPKEKRTFEFKEREKLLSPAR